MKPAVAGLILVTLMYAYFYAATDSFFEHVVLASFYGVTLVGFARDKKSRESLS